MERTGKKVIAVVGATGQQGGAVVRALQAGNQEFSAWFRVNFPASENARSTAG